MQVNALTLEPKCKLCQTTQKLCQSHIIPEFMYKPVYSENHKIKCIRPDGNAGTLQKGLREDLLCSNCESKISKYERHANEILRSIIENNHSGDVLRINADYRKFKLFLLSILWKAGVTTVPTFAIELGSHEEKIRAMLINENPGDEDEYPCLTFFFKDETNLTRSIHQPEEIRLEGHRCFRFLIARLLFIYFVSSHQKPAKAQEMSLKKDGSLNVMLLTGNDYRDMPEFIRAVNIVKNNDS